MTGYLILDVLLGALGLYVFALLLLPLVLLTNWRMNGNFILQAIDPKEIGLPEEVRSYFSRCYQQLGSVGFQFVTVYLIPDLLDNVTCVIALYENRKEKCLAVSVNMFAVNDFETIQDQQMQFSGENNQGITYTINNSKQINVFKQVPERQTFMFPNTRNAAELFKIYRGILQSERVDLNPLPERGQLEALLRVDLMKEIKSQVHTGYLKELPNQQYVPTVLGAYMMMWKNMYPFTQIYWMLVRSQAAKWRARIQA